MLSRFDIPDPGRGERVKSATLAALFKLGRFAMPEVGRRVRASTGLDIVAEDGILGLTAPALTRLPAEGATLPGLVIPRPHSSAMKLSRRRLALL